MRKKGRDKRWWKEDRREKGGRRGEEKLKGRGKKAG